MKYSTSLALPNQTVATDGSFLRAYLMWGLAAIFYFYDYLLQVSPSAMKPELMFAFVKNAEDFGSLSAYCLYAYGLMQIPAGMLLDKLGPRRIITLACVCCATGSLVFGLATTLWQAKMGRLLIGAGAGFALVTCLKIASHWFPQNRFAVMTGLTVTIGFLGAAFGLACVADVVKHLAWRHSLIWGAMIGFLLSICLWWVVRDKNITPHHRPSAHAHEQFLYLHTFQSAFKGFLSVFRNTQTWIAALFAGLMFVPTLAFGGLWGIPFLVEAHGLDRTAAGKCASLIYLGWVAGGAFWGLLSDYWGRRRAPMIIACLFTLCITLVIIYGHHLSLAMMKGLLFGLGFFSSGFIVAFAVVAETNPAHLAGTASGFTNALNTLWGALAQPLIGLILDFNASPSVLSNGERIFSLQEYQQAFLALPICLGLSFLIVLFLKETYCCSERLYQCKHIL